MAEYWKSTPSYWCKFCSQYVRDTGIERKNHEASARHQNSIQRSLRELHKGKEREEREKQRAKAEVARLNGLVDGTKTTTATASKTATAPPRPPPVVRGPTLDPASERRRRAEELVALGVKLPAELERELTGVGGWETVSEKVIEDGAARGRSLADIVKQEGENESKDALPLIRGVHKRKAEDDDDVEEAVPKARKAWGSSMRSYPGGGGGGGEEEDDGDLDALLSGVTWKKAEVKKEEVGVGLKREESTEEKPLDAIPDIDAPAADVKREDGEEALPAVVFKKRKGKR